MVAYSARYEWACAGFESIWHGMSGKIKKRIIIIRYVLRTGANNHPSIHSWDLGKLKTPNVMREQRPSRVASHYWTILMTGDQARHKATGVHWNPGTRHGSIQIIYCNDGGW
jgi:hypothetical protein